MQVRQAKLGVSKMMQPWSCEEDGLASEFQKIKKKRKRKKTAQLGACGGGKKIQTQPEKKAIAKIKFQNKNMNTEISILDATFISNVF